jgi:hypothetical protein
MPDAAAERARLSPPTAGTMAGVSQAFATRMDVLLGVLGFVLLAAAVWTTVLSVRRSWQHARAIAAPTFWLSLFVQLLAWFVIPFAVMRHVTQSLSEGDASSKARVLAESISEGMNSTVALQLATPLAAGVWIVSLWQLRKAKREPNR